MRLPHYFVSNSRWPDIIGRKFAGRPFSAWTLGFWTFLPGVTISAPTRVHEYRHVEQFVAGWALGLVVWGLFTPHLAWLLVTPFTFSAAYGIASLVAWLKQGHPYRDNFFEADARRVAGQP